MSLSLPNGVTTTNMVVKPGKGGNKKGTGKIKTVVPKKIVNGTKKKG